MKQDVVKLEDIRKYIEEKIEFQNKKVIYMKKLEIKLDNKLMYIDKKNYILPISSVINIIEK